MANRHRGETPFRVGGREAFVFYGTRELAEMQSALGFRRPDPFAPAQIIEEDVRVDGGDGLLRQKVLLDAKERQRRTLEAFDAALLNPDPVALFACLRIGMVRWEKANRPLTSDDWHGMLDALGLPRARQLHLEAILNSCFWTPPDEEGADPNAPGAGAPSSTSTT